MKMNGAWILGLCAVLGFSAESFSKEVPTPTTHLLCEGYDARGVFAFWYDIDLFQDHALTRFSRQSEGKDLDISESRTSFFKDGKFSVESPYSDLQARIALEYGRWVLDLMEPNGDFVIPSYDYFECESRSKNGLESVRATKSESDFRAAN